MKRLFILFLIVLLLLGCHPVPQNRFVCASFEADLPAHFQQVPNASILCFAPYGDPLLSSSITFYATELNWYFDTLTEQEYEESLRHLSGYESLTLTELRHLKIDGYDAQRISCKVSIEQGEHDLIVYAIQADQAYFFTLLNRDSDSYTEDFDRMMCSIDLKETKA